ncbi:Shikimate kinase [Polaribacter huanghezhanensis]|uniref:shikimate kinase n=1 Tax=Polaribacter huanghezhanensis TaxID=1354726 RepID=UPI00264A38A0|nr:shikimate kinase [Polaribacter huanghezhanensis]WKD86721.1 Shikimate kinase [Polaribacter huanghezhanensis]
MKIVLLGYMGSGKTTVARYLAHKLNKTFIDLDVYIEEKEKSSISQLFAVKGEIYFRKQEGHYLKEILESKSDYVLALGGGTPCYGTNMEQIKNSNAFSIYLKASIPFLVNRLEFGKKNRPLIANLNNEQLLEYIGKHMFERAPFYEQSDYKVVLDNKTIEEVYCDIAVQLH